MDDSWAQKMMGHDKSTQKKQKQENKIAQDKRKQKLGQHKKHNQVNQKHVSHDSGKPKLGRPDNHKPKTKVITKTKYVNKSKSKMPKGKDLQWNLTLSVNTIAVLTALKKVYNLHNREQAMHKVFKIPLKKFLKAMQPTDKKKFDLFVKSYELDTIPHAKKRWKHLHKN